MVEIRCLLKSQSKNYLLIRNEKKKTATRNNNSKSTLSTTAKMENGQKLHSKPKLQNQMTEIEMTNEIDV